LVDGIYSDLSRFVKNVTEPTNPLALRHAKWQESSRKYIERAFGVLQRKYHFLCKPVEQWCPNLIGNIVTTCIALHNMMVK